MTLTIESTPEDVQAALDKLEADYIKEHKRIETSARLAKEANTTQRSAKRKALKALLAVVTLHDASGGQAAKADDAAGEPAKQRGKGQ